MVWLRNKKKKSVMHSYVVVMGTTGISDTPTASLYELAFTAMRSVSDQSCEVKQRRARLVAGWQHNPGIGAGGDWVVALMLGTISTTMVSEVFDELMQGQL